MEPSSGVVARLGIAQTLAWGSTYYLPAMLATPMARDLGVPTPSPSNAPQAATDEPPSQRLASFALATVFAATWFISTAMAAHLPRLLQAGGATLATAVTVGALIGPAQVGARILEFALLRKVHPLLSARLAAALHPAGALAFGLAGAPAALLFGVLHGAGNGAWAGSWPLFSLDASGLIQRKAKVISSASLQTMGPKTS